MDLIKNSFKAGLREMRLQHGLWCSIRDAAVAEMLAGCGFDWLMFDTEHAPLDPPSVMPLLQAVAPYPGAAIVRPGSLNPVEIKKLLDIGAQTILVPYVEDAEQAALAVASVEYPPTGIRGVAGITRASRFGAIADYPRKAREQIALLIQVETVGALEHLDSILKVPGIDGVFIGPADLAASLGHPGEPSHPQVKQVVLDTIRRVRGAGLPPGILTLDRSFAAQVIDAGAVFVAQDIDLAILRRGALNLRQAKAQ
ncbi:MAG: aldolase/citrate lyase family protein [Neomegalonema sp.]|nr:aldolase/citrate lyase family protein [Neomegalonema sp.]